MFILYSLFFIKKRPIVIMCGKQFLNNRNNLHLIFVDVLKMNAKRDVWVSRQI